MKYFLKRVGVVLFVFACISTLISAGSLWALRHSSFYKPSFIDNTVKEKHFDYIILGASTGLTTLNTRVIDSTIHTKGINLSMDDTALASQYLMLQHFLALGKSTKFCVLAPSATSFDSKRDILSDNDYRFLMYTNRPYVSNHFKQYSSRKARSLALSSWIPSLGVSLYNAELFYPSILSVINPSRRNRFDATGNYTYPAVARQAKVLTNPTVIHLGLTNSYLNKIKELCDKHKIKLICYLSPMESKKVVTKDVGYSIINHSNLLNNSSFFYDDIHVNYKGRKMASLKFANEFRTLLK